MPWECTEAEKDAARLIFEAYCKKTEAESGSHENDIHLTLTGYRVPNPLFSSEDEGHANEKSGGAVGADVKNHLDELQKCKSQYDEVASQLGTVVDKIGDLMKLYENVAQRTSSLHHACEQLLADQTNLATSAEEVHNKLSYFQNVESVMHKLSSPMLNVTNESFIHVLNMIDEALVFLKAHPDYRDSSDYCRNSKISKLAYFLIFQQKFSDPDGYVIKYNQCLSRALTHVRSYIRTVLQNAVDAVQTKTAQQKQTGDPTVDEDIFTLYYGVFAAHSGSTKQLMENIEKRWDLNSEYENLLADCHRFYFDHRQNLVGGSVLASLENVTKKYQKNSCGLLRNGCIFLHRVCEDEVTLYYRYFGRPSELMGDFLERLCMPIYDIARPIVVQVPHLEALAELCSILQNEMLDERCSDETEATVGFARVIHLMLGDIRERLVYRAHMYARSDIAGYNPAPGDLAYPEKLEMMESIASSQNQQQQMSPAPITRTESMGSTSSLEVAGITSGKDRHLSPADLHGFWYPPVRRTILCLSKLYKCLDAAVFQGVSQEILAQCIQALMAAAERIRKEKAWLDGQMFLLKHLLILREQTAPFRMNQPIGELALNLGKIKDAAMNLVHHRNRLFSLSSNNALLEFLLQAPRQMIERSVVETGRVLDVELRRCCQDLINFCSRQHLTSDLQIFLVQAEKILELAKTDPTIKLSKQPFATAKSLKDLVAQAYRRLKDNWPQLKRKFSLYVSNLETEQILISHIRKSVQQSFDSLDKIIRENYVADEQLVIALPSSEQINVLLI